MFAQFRKPITAVLFSMLLTGFLSLTSVLYAQDTESEKPVKKKSPKAGQTAELEGDHFVTNDGVRMSATYYYGNADKDTAPVLLLHGDGGSRRDFTPLIDILTNNGYAVLAADLRGHGKSIKRYEIKPAEYEPQVVTKPSSNNNSGRGAKPKLVTIPVLKSEASKKLVEYLAADFQPNDYMGMAKGDLPFLREMLEKVHIEGMVNLKRLVVVGVGRGAALAAYETAMDWRDRDSDQFTKTLVMIAPAELDARLDLSKGFTNNKKMRTNLHALFAIPNNDTIGQGMAEHIRNALLEKNEDEKIEANFQLFNYPTTKTVQSDKGETKIEMNIAETFSSGESKLGNVVFNFIDKHNKELEIRWSKLK